MGLGPAIKWGTLNAAPTLCFARDHLGKENIRKCMEMHRDAPIFTSRMA